MNVSENRYEWGKRRVEELQKEIEQQEEIIKNTKGVRLIFEKRKLKRLMRLQESHGKEVMYFESHKTKY